VWSGIYTARGWWQRQTHDTDRFHDWPLWDATNDKTPDLSFSPYGGWSQQVMEQYAFDQKVVGILCDLNIVRDGYLPAAPPTTPSAWDPGDALRASAQIRAWTDTLDASLALARG
jgi:hypothetical protein